MVRVAIVTGSTRPGRNNQVALSLFTDFEGFRTFKPGPQRVSEVQTMLDQVVAWGRALKTVREPQTTQSGSP